MQCLGIILFLFLIILVVIMIAIFCGYKNMIYANVFLFFSIGYIFYIVIPILFWLSVEFNYMVIPKFNYVVKVIEPVLLNKLIRTELFFIFCFLFLCLGYIFIKPIPITNNHKKYNLSQIKFLKIIWIINVIICAISAIIIKSQLFKGYNIDLSRAVLNGASARSSFISSVQLLFIISIFYFIAKNPRENLKLSNLLKEKSFFAYYFFIILILSLGGRIQVMSNVISLIIFDYVFNRKSYKIKNMILLLISFFLLSGIYGLARTGNALSLISFENILVNTFAEPIYTSISFFYFIFHYGFPVINFPHELLSDLINIIPTAFWPNKMDYMVTDTDLGYLVYSPFGAQHIFVSLMINFGVIGSFIVFFMLGLIIGILDKKLYSDLNKIIAMILGGVLTFSFFRDPIFLSIIKSSIEFSFLIPAIIMLIIKFIENYKIRLC